MPKEDIFNVWRAIANLCARTVFSRLKDEHGVIYGILKVEQGDTLQPFKGRT